MRKRVSAEMKRINQNFNRIAFTSPALGKTI